MKISKYERKFQKLSKFHMHLISDDDRKKMRFIDGLNKNIALNISKAVYLTY